MIQIEPWAYLFAALLVLTLPLDWLLSALCAAAFHELCHIAAICILGGRVVSVHIGISGAVIETEIQGKGRELVSTIAGPIGSLLLLTFCHIFPKLAICACIQGFFNLLPIYPMDGGRALACCLELTHPSKAKKIMNFTETSLYFAIAILSTLGTIVFSLGILPLLVTMLMILKAMLRKRPCKRSQIRVQ